MPVELAVVHLLLTIAALLQRLHVAPSLQADPTLWVVTGTTRVLKDASPGNGREARLWAARGEYEPFQVVIHAPDGGLTNVRVAISDLVGPNNSRISNKWFSLYREQYVQVTAPSLDGRGSNRPLGPGLYPDGLIPFTEPETGLPPLAASLKAIPFDVDAGKNQPVWVDLWVPRETPAGSYSGFLDVTADQGSGRVPVILGVWNFELPLQPSLRSSFAIYNPGAEDLANHQVLLRHKLMPRIVNPQDAPKLVDQYGLNITALWIWTNAHYGNCVLPPPPSASALAKEASNHPAGTPLYVYSADEIADCVHLFPMLKTWAQVIHAAGVENLVTSPPLAELQDDGSGTGRSVADIWALLPKQLTDYSAEVAAVQKKGDQVWSYNALSQDTYSPKWLINYEPINYRIHAGFLSQQQGLKGLLYWRVNNWGTDPWNNADYFENGKPYPGEGMLVYPGAPVGLRGFAPSMRLKWLREGVEDYEYVQILKRAGRGEWALQQVRTLAPDWAHWNQNPRALEDLRFRLGQEIERIAADHSLDGGNLIRNAPPARRSTREY